MSNSKTWYKSWFDTKYYHILYKKRDNSEAKKFIKKLVKEIGLKNNQSVLDLACGKGRHSIFLNELGYDVTGVDLSNKNIDFAKKFSNNKLKFFKHDMREPINGKFDAVLNLFTSFGYFDDIEEDIKVIESIKNSLNKNGIGVIDFMNSKVIIESLVSNESINHDDVIFNVTRCFDGRHIVKKIQIIDNKNYYNFEEKVRAYKISDFKLMLERVNLSIINTYGCYNMSKFNENFSQRMILVFKIKE